ncbi:MAG: carboxypeptidase-like regulatory domain-containing protein, partial [Odoribacter sp.]|nr:carboxypeptidase-like regulatory domain-containing protein [Odoribacter sp.]
MTLKVADATVMEALHEANRLCGNRILFMKEEVEREKAKVTVDVTEQPILEVVRKIVAGTSLTCTEKDGRVVVMPVAQKETVVRGTVSDDRGNPLPGVTVIIKGTGMGVVTDAEGKYALQLPGTQDVRLLFTFIGMKTQEVAYAGQKEVNVTMYEEATKMDEVVVTGYQNIDRRKNTSAVTSVKTDDIMLPSVTSIDKMLEGRV